MEIVLGRTKFKCLPV